MTPEERKSALETIARVWPETAEALRTKIGRGRPYVGYESRNPLLRSEEAKTARRLRNRLFMRRIRAKQKAARG